MSALLLSGHYLIRRSQSAFLINALFIGFFMKNNHTGFISRLTLTRLTFTAWLVLVLSGCGGSSSNTEVPDVVLSPVSVTVILPKKESSFN